MSSVKYAISTIVVACAVILVLLTVMGPKIGLQTPPIERKAMAQLEKMHALQPGDSIVGYKATSYYSYSSGVVVTTKRIFAFYHDKIITSIPLDKITMVLVKDTELGHQEVLVSATTDGVIGVDLHHADVEKFVDMLHISASILKHYTRHDIREALKTTPAAQPGATEIRTPAPTH